MKLFEIYFIKNISSSLFNIILTITGIVWLGQVLKLLYLFDKGISIFSFLGTSILVIPSLLYFILPFGSLSSALVSFNHFKTNNELIILQNAGVNLLNIMKPMLKLSFILVIISYILSFYLVPLSFHKLKTKIDRFEVGLINSFIQEGVFNNINSEMVIYVEKKLDINSFEGVILIDFSNKNSKELFLAKNSTFYIKNNDIYVSLKNGQRQSKSLNGKIDYMSFDNLNVLIKSKKSSSKSKNTLQEYYIHELMDSSNFEGNQAKYLAELHNRILWPIFCLILPFIALTIFLKTQFSRGGYFKSIAKAFIIALCPMIIHFIIINLSLQNINMIFLLYVNLVFCILLIKLYYKLGDYV